MKRRARQSRERLPENRMPLSFLTPRSPVFARPNGDEDDLDNPLPGGLKKSMVDGATYKQQVGTAFSAESPAASGYCVDTIDRVRNHLAARPTHICQNSLDNCLPSKPSLTGDRMRRRRVSTVEAYLTCSMPIHDDGITGRSLDQLFLCPECNKEEVTLTAANSEALYKLVLEGFRTSSGHGFVDAFEVVLRNGPRESCLPCLYGGLVDFPYSDLGLCTCSLRPFYVAIYYSNVCMMSLLLCYGAHVMRTEHICPYEEPRAPHACRCRGKSRSHAASGFPRSPPGTDCTRRT
ncbi:hypothetical protein HPB48_005706 [Haemaphysalis longicornis]|uniref:Uncharacterized protein n=1 Tax=Haemaphysalis longicornis TaxID=44386 RepID=A0A9J6F6T9_HAELO|nr:hypothetical protein HPB48_005706 [Haemaphysalis longicornis]